MQLVCPLIILKYKHCNFKLLEEILHLITHQNHFILTINLQMEIIIRFGK